jgi:hypothetical protein
MERGLKLEIFLKKSKLRREVWKKLDKAKTATEIAKEESTEAQSAEFF